MINKSYLLKWGLVLGFLQSLIFALCIYFWDFYAGMGTAGFGIMGTPSGIGMFWIYMVSFFNSFIVMTAIYKGRKFGMGVLVYLPYALVGFFLEAYYEYFETPVLVSLWAVVGWCAFGLLAGLIADITFKILKEKTPLSEKSVAGLSAALMSSAYFLFTWIGLEFFYISGSAYAGPGSFLGVAYFCVPWMIINAFLGGYLASTIFSPQKSLKENE